MRRQPSAWARSTSASSRGYSDPFLARCPAVQSSRRPIVQPCCSVLVGWATISLLLQPLFLVEILQRLNEFFHFSGDDGVQLVEVEIDAVVGDAVLREIIGADALAAV